MSAVVERTEEPKSFPGMLQLYQKQIAVALPKHINPDRMCRVALTCFRMNPGLAKCDPASVFAAVVILAQQGLEPGLNGRAYLVPYFNNQTGKTECQAIPGWKGLVELANRTGRCTVWTGAVFDGDDFDYQLGDSPYVKHRPKGEDDPKKLLFAYAVGRIKGNDLPTIEVWPNKRIEHHFKRFNKVGARHYAHGNWEMYARKVVLLQVLKYMPSSPELEVSMALADSDSSGRQNLDIKDAIEGTFMPTYESDDAGGAQQQGASVSAINDKIKAGGADTSSASASTTATTSTTTGGPTDNEIANLILQAKTPEDLDGAIALLGNRQDKQAIDLRQDAQLQRAELTK